MMYHSRELNHALSTQQREKRLKEQFLRRYLGVLKYDKHLVIKGAVTKSEKVIKSRDDDKGGGSLTTRDQYKVTVKVIDMSTVQ